MIELLLVIQLVHEWTKWINSEHHKLSIVLYFPWKTESDYWKKRQLFSYEPCISHFILYSIPWEYLGNLILLIWKSWVKYNWNLWCSWVNHTATLWYPSFCFTEYRHKHKNDNYCYHLPTQTKWIIHWQIIKYES